MGLAFKGLIRNFRPVREGKDNERCAKYCSKMFSKMISANTSWEELGRNIKFSFVDKCLQFVKLMRTMFDGGD